MDTCSKSQAYTNAIDKLVTVSKIFADQRVSELLAENQKLKLKLFWTEYGTTQLQEAMCFANKKVGGPACNCIACAVSERKDSDLQKKAADGLRCIFKPYFDALLCECEIISKKGGSGERIQHMSNTTGNYVFDEDCHVVQIHTAGNFAFDKDCHLVQLGKDDWYAFTYGSRLWKANSVNNPELLKLRKLFEKLKKKEE